jgi:predicted NAD/FAD-binding protein
LELPDGSSTTVDNGQHILIGAYTRSLALMRQVGVDIDAALLRQPLGLVHADGAGIRLPDWPAHSAATTLSAWRNSAMGCARVRWPN